MTKQAHMRRGKAPGVLLGFALAILVSCVIWAGHGSAQTVSIPRSSNVRTLGVVEVTPAQALTSTTPTAVTGAVVSAATARDPAEVTFQGSPNYVPDFLHVRWNVDVTKATSTGGTCAVYANTVLVTRSARTFTPGAWPSRGSLSGITRLSRADLLTGQVPGTPQVIAIYCNSADTAAFTVNAATLEVIEHY